MSMVIKNPNIEKYILLLTVPKGSGYDVKQSTVIYIKGHVLQFLYS